MAQVLVEYFSPNRLACANCTPADVILCVDPDLVVVPNCLVNTSGNPPGTGITDGTGLKTSAGENRPIKSYIEASLVTFIQTRDNCNKPVYRYIFSYDDTQLLLPPSTIFTGENILGVFCRGCLTDWVTDLVGEDVTVRESDAGIITIRNQHGCEFEFRRGWTRLVQANDCTITITYPDLTTATLSIGATLVANLDRTFTFSNGIVAPVTFCQGITVVDGSVGCNGIGAANMVRGASLSGCTLTLSSAPEHTEISSPQVEAVQSGLTDLITPGNSFFSNPAELNIVNSSTCRGVIALNSVTASIEFESGLANTFVFFIQLSVDGGAYTDLYGRRSYCLPGTPGNRWEYGKTFQFLRSLAASQTENIRVRIKLTPFVGNISIDSCSISNVVIGGTL